MQRKSKPKQISEAKQYITPVGKLYRNQSFQSEPWSRISSMVSSKNCSSPCGQWSYIHWTLSTKSYNTGKKNGALLLLARQTTKLWGDMPSYIYLSACAHKQTHFIWHYRPSGLGPPIKRRSEQECKKAMQKTRNRSNDSRVSRGFVILCKRQKQRKSTPPILCVSGAQPSVVALMWQNVIDPFFHLLDNVGMRGQERQRNHSVQPIWASFM